MHNFCLLNDNFDNGYFLDGDDEDHDAEQQYPDARAKQKRAQLMNIVCGLAPQMCIFAKLKCRWQKTIFSSTQLYYIWFDHFLLLSKCLTFLIFKKFCIY